MAAAQATTFASADARQARVEDLSHHPRLPNRSDRRTGQKPGRATAAGSTGTGTGQRQIQARFVDLPEARDLGDVDLLLLRKAYEVVMGG